MQIIPLNKSIDRVAWMEMRRSKITGKTAKTTKPPTRGTNKGQVDGVIGFWGILAGKISEQKDAEDPKSRGDRLEPVAIQMLAEKLELNADTEPGMWQSDENEDIAITPDGAEKSKKPTWAAEVKALDTAVHLKFVVRDKRARKFEHYKPIESVPNEQGHYYREQAIQYFTVCETLQTLYFIFIDDRVAVDGFDFHYLEIKREDVLEEIEDQRTQEIETLAAVDRLIKEILEGKL